VPGWLCGVGGIMTLPASIQHKRQNLRWFWVADRVFLLIFVGALVLGFFAITFTSQVPLH
jgi:hypothetical protein